MIAATDRVFSKSFLPGSLLVITVLVISCSKRYDDKEVKKAISETVSEIGSSDQQKYDSKTGVVVVKGNEADVREKTNEFEKKVLEKLEKMP